MHVMVEYVPYKKLLVFADKGDYVNQALDS